MKSSLLDTYIKAISELEELAFQRAIVQRLLVALSNFQTVSSYPQGDGGLDGYSHKGTRAYCCYGLKYDSAKTPLQRSRQIAAKFSSDLRRLYELDQDGKKLIHNQNAPLLSIFGGLPSPDKRISHVTLIANWLESHTPQGTINQNVALYAAASECRWLAPDADVVLRGPKEFADQYGADESTMNWLKNQDLLTLLDKQAQAVDLLKGPTFDTKIDAAKMLHPGAKNEIDQLADILRADWQRAIAFDQHISDRSTQQHSALERGRRRLLLKVLTHTSSTPFEAVAHSQEFAEGIFDDDFSPVFGKAFVRDLASGEVGRLIGDCALDWRKVPANGGE